MKVICLINQLKEKVSIAERISGKSHVLPILNTILLSTANNHLKIISTNLEAGFEVFISAKIEKEGRVAVPAKVLSNFLNSLPDGEKITLEEKNNNLSLLSGKTLTTIKGYSAEEFPVIPAINEKNIFSLPVSDFVNGIKSVYHAAAVSDVRAEISSIFIEGEMNKPLKFVATDSFRLAERKVPGADAGYHFSLLLPYKSAAELLRIFGEKEGKMEIVSNDNQVLISSSQDKMKFVSKTVEGVFPDYNQVVPKSFSTEAILNKRVFVDAIKSASVFSNRLGEILVQTNTQKGLCGIRTANSDLGDHESEIPAALKGEDSAVTFNYHYLLSGISQVVSDNVFVGLSGADKPAVIKPVDENSYFSLIMPMKNSGGQ